MRARATNFAVISSPRSVVDRWAQRSRSTRSGELSEYSTYALLRLRRKAQRQKEGPALPKSAAARPLRVAAGWGYGGRHTGRVPRPNLHGRWLWSMGVAEASRIAGYRRYRRTTPLGGQTRPWAPRPGLGLVRHPYPAAWN